MALSTEAGMTPFRAETEDIPSTCLRHMLYNDRLTVSSAPWYQENAPGLIRTTGAMLFPIGLVMIVLTGADLFTSNVMVFWVSLLTLRLDELNLV